ncbi:MAG TPA: sugar ABC transporter permease [Bradyrhizobium sp.]|nr:sugar ABC transporter permease [Bradyrhizobium sp.]
MAHPLADERTSFIRFALAHKFVTLFGILMPLAVFAVFVGYPIVFTIYLSFFDWNGMAPHKTFVGLRNYRYLVSDRYFYTALFNNVKWVGVTLFFPVLLGLVIAYGLRSKIIPAPALIRTVIFFPVTMSLISVGLMFLLILNPLFGAFDTILQSIGLGSLVMEWFGDYRIALYTLAVVSGWAFTGMPMILYFAGLGDVPKETFDAAKIEGAGHFRMLTQVAVPQLRPVTAVVVMLTLFESLRAFDLVAVMTKGAPFGSTNVLGYLVYLESFWNSRFGYGATLSVAILVISILMATFVMTKLMKGAFDV